MDRLCLSAVVAMVPGSYAFRAMIGGSSSCGRVRRNAVALLTATAAALIGALVLTTAIAIGLSGGLGAARSAPAANLKAS